MIETTVLKYYSLGRYSDPAKAQEEVNKLVKKHRNRYYTILVNMRAQTARRYTVCQIKSVTVRIPDPEKDLGLVPPKPPGPLTQGRWSQDPTWQDYFHEVDLHAAQVRKEMKPSNDELHEKMNP